MDTALLFSVVSVFSLDDEFSFVGVLAVVSLIWVDCVSVEMFWLAEDSVIRTEKHSFIKKYAVPATGSNDSDWHLDVTVDTTWNKKIGLYIYIYECVCIL